MKKGTSSKLGAVITEDTDIPITFESSNPSIATVNQKGIVNAINKGMVTITLKLNDSSLKIKIRVIDW